MKTRILILAVLIVINYVAFGQERKEKLPGNIELPSSQEELKKLALEEKGTFKYRVEDFLKKPKQNSFKYSPNGRYISYRQKDELGNNHIYVKNILTEISTLVIKEEVNLIRDYYWANDNRFVYIKDKGGNENYHLFAVDLNGGNQIELTPYENVKVTILNSLEDQKNYMIILMNKENKRIYEPYKINIKTGDLVKLFENKDPENPIVEYNFDKDGNLKAYFKQRNGIEYILYYQLGNDNKFEEKLKIDWNDNFTIIGFNYTTENPHDAFVTSNMNSDKNEIILFDFEKNKEISKIYSNETFDIKGLKRSRKRKYEIDYFFYNGEKPVIIPVSSTYKKIDEKLSKKFGENNYNIVSQTENEDKLLIYVTTDRLYGVYYEYNTVKEGVRKVFDLMPELNPNDMGEMKPINFVSRDGLIIYGYLTVPKKSKKIKIPLIVNPHGGPYGVRNNWGFSSVAQLFASRGYATLQINYRGSGGYGKKFFSAGNKQVGRKMLNDLEDGVAYVKSLDLIDEKNIAIYGGSYGGLATLGSLVKTPELYSCGVDYIGVSNLFTFFKSFPPYWKPYLKQMYEQWYDENSSEDRIIMKKVSPALNVDKITKPLFVIQGANDPRVNINELDQIVKNLRDRGFYVPYMVKYNEGHGFGHEENRIEMYKTMMGFLAKNLKN